MSHVTLAEIVTAVATVYRVSLEDMRKNRKHLSPMEHEARCCVAFLAGRHTMAAMAHIAELLQVHTCGGGGGLFETEIASFERRLLADPWRSWLVERAERDIDRIHELRTDPRKDLPSAVPAPEARKVKPRVGPPVCERTMSKQWWSSNDQVFRAAFEASAE